MRMKDIPVGHVAQNRYLSIVLRGHEGAMWLNGPSSMEFTTIDFFSDDYEDLGPLDYIVGLQKPTGQAVRFAVTLRSGQNVP